MHGPDSHHGGGDHSYHHDGGNGYPGHPHGPGDNHHHHAGGGDHAGPQGSHDLSIAHVGDFAAHAGGIAVEGLVFMAAIDFIAGHHNPGFHYSFHNNNINVHYDHARWIDGTGINKVRGQGSFGQNRLRMTNVNATHMNEDSRIFIVHAHNIGTPDLDVLFRLIPEQFGFVDVTNRPNFAGVKEEKKGVCFGWDWTRPKDGPLPPGALPGVTVDSKRNKRVFQLGKPAPHLSLMRRLQLLLGIGRPARKGELVADPNANCVTECYDNEWDYKETGTAEAKLEFRVKPSRRYRPGLAPFHGFLFSRPAVTPAWYIVWEPYQAHRRATLAMAKAFHRELSEFRRVPGKLEAYRQLLSKLPDGDKYLPGTDLPDGVSRGTAEDEAELQEWELEQERNRDRNSDSQLPTTLPPLPTTPATPVTPAPTVDGLPPTPDADTGSAVDGLPGWTPNAPAAPAAPAAVAGPADAPTPTMGLAPSGPGTVTADLALPAQAPMPETQYKLNGTPVSSVDSDGGVEVHVNLSDFRDDRHGHHA